MCKGRAVRVHLPFTHVRKLIQLHTGIYWIFGTLISFYFAPIGADWRGGNETKKKENPRQGGFPFPFPHATQARGGLFPNHKNKKEGTIISGTARGEPTEAHGERGQKSRARTARLFTLDFSAVSRINAQLGGFAAAASAAPTERFLRRTSAP